jgi:ABC-type multidrug transport system fused ATPase/permease subunit
VNPNELDSFIFSTMKLALKKAINLNKQLIKIACKGNGKLFIVRTFASISIGILPSLQAYLLSLIIANLILKKDLLYLLTAFTLIQIAFTIISSLKISISNYSFWKQVYQLQVFYHKKIANLTVCQIEDNENQNLISIISENFFAVVRYIDRFFPLLEAFIKAFIAIIIVFYVSPLLTIAMLLLSLPYLYADMRYGRSIYLMEKDITEARRKGYLFSKFLKEHKLLEEIKILSVVNSFINELTLINKGLITARYNVDFYYGKIRTLLAFISDIPIVTFILYLVYQYTDSRIEISLFALTVASLFNFKQAFSSFFSLLAEQLSGYSFITDFIKFSNLAKTNSKTSNNRKLLEVISKDIAPQIVFENVSFHYPNSDKFVLENISFTVNSNEKVAIVGSIGAGKSTILKLLFKFYEPSAGRILVNNIDLREVNSEEWYKHIGVVLQDFSQFFLTVKEGIALGRNWSPPDNDFMRDILEEFGFLETIERLPSKFNTVTDKMLYGGVDLSKGQNQLLSIVRAIYRKSTLLILDEPTSALDSATEQKVFHYLNKQLDKSIIFVAHRLSTVEQATKIIVLENGKISDIGEHEELLKRCVLYSDMFKFKRNEEAF